MAKYDTTTPKLSIIQDLQPMQARNPNIYAIPMKEVARDLNGRIKKLEYGDRIRYDVSKVVMMVGATGSGKTTLINSLVNYVFGVEWDDPFRFKMIVEDRHANQAKSQTKDITSYNLPYQDGFQVPYSLTIIDTPGFGDTEGVQRDKEIIEQIRTFFTTPGDAGISHIDAVGFVAQASQPRLTSAQSYIFENILALFGVDIKDNIFLFLTYADNQKPRILSAVREAKIPFKKYFRFNNSALYGRIGNDDDDDDDDDDGYPDFGSFFWDMGCTSFKIFFEQLLQVESKSLVLTKDVLNERKRIEVYVEGIQQDIRIGLSSLETLNREKEALKEHEDDINQNKNHTFEIEEDVLEIVNLGFLRSMTNCMECKRTCCRNCVAYVSPNLYLCCAMEWDGRCKICPSHCMWTDHKSCSYEFEFKRVKSQRTNEDVRRRYEKAQKKKLSTQEVIKSIEEDFEEKQVKIIKMAKSVRRSLQRLREIALRPDPLTTVEYLDILIENEKTQAKAGWLDRVGQLEQLRKKAEQIKDIDSGNDLL